MARRDRGTIGNSPIVGGYGGREDSQQPRLDILARALLFYVVERRKEDLAPGGTWRRQYIVDGPFDGSDEAWSVARSMQQSTREGARRMLERFGRADPDGGVNYFVLSLPEIEHGRRMGISI